MIRLSDLFSPQKRLLQQAQELNALRGELALLKARDESMRKGMRRCLTCDYRLTSKDE